jgi:hypothetical protein
MIHGEERSRYRSWYKYRSRPLHAFSCIVQGHVLPYHTFPFNVPKLLVCESVRGRERKKKRGNRERVCGSVGGRERKA